MQLPYSIVSLTMAWYAVSFVLIDVMFRFFSQKADGIVGFGCDFGYILPPI